jgi:cyclo(L-tyrosyl-L-tyrosyl) synthase
MNCTGHSRYYLITQYGANDALKKEIFNLMMQLKNNISEIYYPIETQYLPKIEHSLIVVSPFNGYFTSQNMEILFRWANDNCLSFDVFTMDKASKYNLIAMGYEESHAVKKTRKQDINLYNKIITCLKNIGFSEEESKKKILLISHLDKNKNYLRIYKHCMELFETNANFRNDCLNLSKCFLETKMEEISDKSMHIAVNYILEELPVWFDTPSIIGIPSSVLVYKDFSLFWQKICLNYNLVASNQKILIKNINDPKSHTKS